jgi:hypothetical protein
MSLADEMRQKAEDARRQQEQEAQLDENQRTELAVKEAKEFLKRTKRLATSRLNRITQLIEGAASVGKNSIEFPSPWVSSTDFLETQVVFGEITKDLQSKGFNISAEQECRDVKPFKTLSTPEDTLHGILLNRVVLNIHWN